VIDLFVGSRSTFEITNAIGYEEDEEVPEDQEEVPEDQEDERGAGIWPG
jgi:hypothetical protein